MIRDYEHWWTIIDRDYNVGGHFSLYCHLMFAKHWMTVRGEYVLFEM